MRDLVYQVRFLSDVVLPATSNTEGSIQQLDFIPGSNFLGMVARAYGDFEESFQVFHSGAVQFGDATLLKGDQQTYKIPLSYFHEKLEDKTIFNHHHIGNFKAFNQLKQKRTGYITKACDLTGVEYTYTQKSAYDKENRRTKDGAMYGYNAIRSGTCWQFSIKINDEKICPQDIALIEQTIVGQKRLGKSKSAQYGLIEIEQKGQREEIEDISNTHEVILYANSRLALVDSEGNPTYDLTYLCSGLSDAHIVYDKTQMRTSTFTPYNGARQTKDYERVCINKGSVIVLKDVTEEQLKELKSGVGVYLSEGFGEVLVNPSFVSQKEGFTLNTYAKEQAKKDQKKKIEETFKDPTVQFLVNRHNTSVEKLEVANDVAAFIEKNKPIYSKKMNSQWGTIRSLCMHSSEKTIKDAVSEYISKGVAKEKWAGAKGTELLNAIEKSREKLQFTKLLSIQMPKVKEAKND